MVPLKYLSNFRRTLKVPLINCEIIVDLNWSEKCVIVATDVADQGTTFWITDTRLYVSLLTLSTKEQLTGRNIGQKYQQKEQINI